MLLQQPPACKNALSTFLEQNADLPPGIDTGDLLPPPPPGGPTGRPPGPPRPPAQAPSQHQQRLRPQMSGWGPSAGPPGSEGSSRKREYESAFPEQGMASGSQDVQDVIQYCTDMAPRQTAKIWIDLLQTVNGCNAEAVVSQPVVLGCH
jgi:hypothetical protein